MLVLVFWDEEEMAAYFTYGYASQSILFFYIYLLLHRLILPPPALNNDEVFKSMD